MSFFHYQAKNLPWNLKNESSKDSDTAAQFSQDSIPHGAVKLKFYVVAFECARTFSNLKRDLYLLNKNYVNDWILLRSHLCSSYSIFVLNLISFCFWPINYIIMYITSVHDIPLLYWSQLFCCRILWYIKLKIFRYWISKDLLALSRSSQSYFQLSYYFLFPLLTIHMWFV